MADRERESLLDRMTRVSLLVGSLGGGAVVDDPDSARTARRDGRSPGRRRRRSPSAVDRFGRLTLRELEGQAAAIPLGAATLLERSRYGVTQALRQVLNAAVGWDYIAKNPATKAAATRSRPAKRSTSSPTRPRSTGSRSSSESGAASSS